MKILKVYLSGSLISASQIENIISKFPKDMFDFFLPHTIPVDNIPHNEISKDVFDLCLKKMEESDIGIINLDSYSKDSSWEAGWYHAHKKPLIGYVCASLTFLKDWMVKGGLDGILIDNEVLVDVIVSDPILKHRKENIKIFNRNNIYIQVLEIIENDKKFNEIK